MLLKLLFVLLIVEKHTEHKRLYFIAVLIWPKRRAMVRRNEISDNFNLVIVINFSDPLIRPIRFPGITAQSQF